MKKYILYSAFAFVLGTYASSVEQGNDLISPDDWRTAPQGQRIIPNLKDSLPIDGAKRKEIFYGPYTIPAQQMVNTTVFPAQGPCNNCYVTAMRATVKYPDGNEALTSEGVWLHHTMLKSLNGGPIWAAGNERPTIRLNGKDRYGIDWPSSFSMDIDVMSEKKEPVIVSLSVTYEYIEKDSKMGKLYKGSQMMWMDVGKPLPKEGKKTYKSMPWTLTSNGKLLYVIGHMHDGGTNMNLYINGNVVCNSIMFYNKDSTTETFGSDHISNPGACTDFGTIKKGDIMITDALYDLKKHRAMTHEDKPERLMGIMRIYMGPE